MADVFRLGARDVHRANRLPNGKVETVIDCNLDNGTDWDLSRPVGPECSVCFSGYNQRRKPGRKSAAAGGAGVLALVAAVVAGGSNGDPVTALASPSFLITLAPTVLVTPGPSAVPSSATPALTPTDAVPTLRPAPRPTFVPTPAPTARPTPHPSPSPAPTCGHPGGHLGLSDAAVCRWWEKHG